MPEWGYAIIAILPITAFWTAYNIFKALEKRNQRKDKDE